MPSAPLASDAVRDQSVVDFALLISVETTFSGTGTTTVERMFAEDIST